MFIYHEKSECVTLSTEQTVGAVDARLYPLHRHLGYLPLEGGGLSIKDCLSRRIPNRYFFRYGDIADLCIAWEARLQAGPSLSAKPKATIGPDLKHLFVGSGVHTPMDFESCTLKVFRLPEEERFLLYRFSKKPESEAFLHFIFGKWIRPLAVWTDENELGIALAGSPDVLEMEVSAIDGYLKSKGGEALPVDHALQTACSQIVHGHHPLNGGLIATLPYHLPEHKEGRRPFSLDKEWIKIFARYQERSATV